MSDQTKTKKYLAVVAAIALLLMTAELGINAIVDPLFFFGGNKITGKGYYLNERISVIAHNRNLLPNFDCLVFGSSRLTFLDVSRISGHVCANMSFSGGAVDEFIDYAKYLKTQGVRPNLIVIGIDRFAIPEDIEDVPDFVRNKETIPGWISYYSSIDSLWFSIQALAGITRSPNYYDRNFRKHIGYQMRRPGKAHPSDYFPGLPQGDQSSTENKFSYYRQLCSVFPEARCIGIIPPVSTWAVERALKQGIDPYFGSVKRLSGIFDSLYDFSILPKPEWDFSETSDGIHFSANVYDYIARKISDPGSETWGFDVKTLPPALYEQRYIAAAQKAIAERKRLNGL